MRRALITLAMLALLGGVLRAQKPEKAPRFTPVRVVSTTEATYPITSVASGTVVLEAMIGQSGEIEDIKVIHGITSLTEAAESAVRKWKFRPATLGGKPLTTAIVVAFSFNPFYGPHAR